MRVPPTPAHAEHRRACGRAARTSLMGMALRCRRQRRREAASGSAQCASRFCWLVNNMGCQGLHQSFFLFFQRHQRAVRDRTRWFWRTCSAPRRHSARYFRSANFVVRRSSASPLPGQAGQGVDDLKPQAAEQEMIWSLDDIRREEMLFERALPALPEDIRYVSQAIGDVIQGWGVGRYVIDAGTGAGKTTAIIDLLTKKYD